MNVQNTTFGGGRLDVRDVRWAEPGVNVQNTTSGGGRLDVRDVWWAEPGVNVQNTTSGGGRLDVREEHIIVGCSREQRCVLFMFGNRLEAAPTHLAYGPREFSRVRAPWPAD